jgi:hypothetical protein
MSAAIIPGTRPPAPLGNVFAERLVFCLPSSPTVRIFWPQVPNGHCNGRRAIGDYNRRYGRAARKLALRGLGRLAVCVLALGTVAAT